MAAIAGRCQARNVPESQPTASLLGASRFPRVLLVVPGHRSARYRTHPNPLPNEICVETKSLKFYLTSFRNAKAFNEEIVNRILADLVAALDPKEAVVRGDFSPRGGISLTAQASHPVAQWQGLTIDER